MKLSAFNDNAGPILTTKAVVITSVDDADCDNILVEEWRHTPRASPLSPASFFVCSRLLPIVILYDQRTAILLDVLSPERRQLRLFHHFLDFSDVGKTLVAERWTVLTGQWQHKHEAWLTEGVMTRIVALACRIGRHSFPGALFQRPVQVCWQRARMLVCLSAHLKAGGR